MNEVKKVIKLIKKDYPDINDYNVRDQDGKVELFDINDKLIGIITENQLTSYWNKMEGMKK